MCTWEIGHLVIPFAESTLKNFSPKPPTLTENKKWPQRDFGHKSGRESWKQGSAHDAQWAFSFLRVLPSPRQGCSSSGAAQGAVHTEQSIPTPPGLCLSWIFPSWDNPWVPEPPAVQKGNNSAAPGMFAWISTRDSKKGKTGVGNFFSLFFFFLLGEGRLVVFIHSHSKSPDLQQHFLVLRLEFRQDKNITQSSLWEGQREPNPLQTLCKDIWMEKEHQELLH